MIVLEVNGVPYINFLDISVSRSMETISGSFNATATIDSFGNFPIKLQDNVRVLINNIPVLTGFIEEVDPSYDVNDHTVRLSGRDVTCDVIDSSIAKSFNISPAKGNVTLKSAIEKLLDINKIKIPVIDLVSPPPFKTGDTLDGEVGQNMFDIINKYCKKRQVLATTDGKGNLVLVRGGVNSVESKLIHRESKGGDVNQNDTQGPNSSQRTIYNNILRANAPYSTVDRFYKYNVETQSNISSVTISGGKIVVPKAVSQSGDAFDENIRKTRTLRIPSDTANDDETSKNRAIWEANVRRSRGFNYNCSVQGFVAVSKPEVKLWEPNTLVFVDDEKCDINSQLLIKSVTYSFSNSGSETSMNLGVSDSFNLEANQNTIKSRSNKFGFDV